MNRNGTRALLIAALAGLGLSAAACTDTTVEPKSSVTGANVFNDAASYKSFLAKLYAGLVTTGQQGPAGSGDIQSITDEGFSQYVRQYWQMEELPTDEAIIGWGDAGLPEMTTQIWSSSNQFFAAMFSRVFFQVGLVNEFLRETTDAKLSERNVGTALRTEIQQYRAEARFLRALSYWHGLDLFGNIPLVDETFPIGATPPDQASRADIFAFIESELNAIQSALPAPHAGQYGRADQGAVLMLKAKLFLNAEAYGLGARYGDARAALETLINSGGYTLDTNYRRMFQADNHTSPEIIFAVPQDGQKTQTWGGTTFLVHAGVGGNMSPADFGIDGGWWGLRVRPQIVSLFENGANGPDKRSGILFTNGQNLAINSIGNFNDGLGFPKYSNVTSTGQAGSNSTFPDTDFPMFRLADAYLMYAEAVLRNGGGSAATALGYVNAIRQRAYGGASGNITAAQLTLPFILAERGRELTWEGHRRNDLIRYGLFTGGDYIWSWKGGVQAGRATETFRRLYPIPAGQLLANPKLTQNAGY